MSITLAYSFKLGRFHDRSTILLQECFIYSVIVNSYVEIFLLAHSIGFYYHHKNCTYYRLRMVTETLRSFHARLRFPFYLCAFLHHDKPLSSYWLQSWEFGLHRVIKNKSLILTDIQHFVIDSMARVWTIVPIRTRSFYIIH